MKITKQNIVKFVAELAISIGILAGALIVGYVLTLWML